MQKLIIHNKYQQMKKHKSNQKKLNFNIDLNTQIEKLSYSII